MHDRDFSVPWLLAWTALGGTVRPALGFYGRCPPDLTEADLADMIIFGKPEPAFYASRRGLPTLGEAPHMRISSAAEWWGALKALEYLACSMPLGIPAILDAVRKEDAEREIASQMPSTAQSEAKS